MNEVKYKMKDGTFIESNNQQVPANFTGYKIRKDYNKISSIHEYLNSQVIGVINFRPTIVPVIFSARFGNYQETRYSNGNIMTVCNIDSYSMLNGEAIRYNVNGVINNKTYHYEHKNVTEDIKSFIGYTGGDMNFVDYQFGEDEIFNIYMRYGSKFKFFNEYRIDKSIIDDIAKFCIE
jgi:hypothetical protein